MNANLEKIKNSILRDVLEASIATVEDSLADGLSMMTVGYGYYLTDIPTVERRKNAPDSIPCSMFWR